MKCEAVSEYICERGNIIRSYLEICTTLFSNNKLAWRTLSRQTDTWMSKVTQSQLADSCLFPPELSQHSFLHSIYFSLHFSFSLFID